MDSQQKDGGTLLAEQKQRLTLIPRGGPYHYSGTREPRGRGGIKVTVFEPGSDKSPAPLPHQMGLVCHSPDGFNWGYGGSGPAQLAIAICVHALRGDERRALAVYHEFKFSVVAGWRSDSWSIDQAEVIREVERIEAGGAR